MKTGHVAIFVSNRVKHCDSAASQLCGNGTIYVESLAKDPLGRPK